MKIIKELVISVTAVGPVGLVPASRELLALSMPEIL